MKVAVLSVLVAVWRLAAQDFYSTEKEAALGARLAEQVRSNTTVIDNAAVNDYVAQVGAKLRDGLDGPVYQFTFTMIADDRGGATHEPLALPGGYVFVPANLMLTAQNEAEFAGMLAHAMAHVKARLRQARAGQVVNAGSVPLVFLGGGWVGETQFAVPSGMLPKQRGFELEADAQAIQAMGRAGWAPKALEEYIGRQQRDGGPGPFSQLPTRSTRIEEMEKAIGSLPAGDYVLTTSAFASAQTALRQSKQ